MATGDYIYIKHGMPIGSSMYDFFIKAEKVKRYHSYQKFVGEYWMSECEYVKQFLKSHPEFKYVGSSDSFNHRPKIPFRFKLWNQQM